jgi:hypothetical protein
MHDINICYEIILFAQILDHFIDRFRIGSMSAICECLRSGVEIFTAEKNINKLGIIY